MRTRISTRITSHRAPLAVALALAALTGCASDSITTVPSRSAGPTAQSPEPVAEPLPDLDKLWDFGDAAATEGRFRELLPRAKAGPDRGYEFELRTQLARTLGLQRRFEEAHTVLDRVEAELPTGPSIARVRYLLERGRVMNTSGDREGSKSVFHGAYRTARSAGSDAYAVDAAHMLGIACEGQESLEWNGRALEIALESSDEKARRWRWTLANNTGWTHHEMGDYPAAIARWRTALAVAEERGQEKQRRISLWCIARGQRSDGRLAEALAAQQALAEVYTAEGKEDGYVTEEIAECLHALGRVDEARPLFARAYAVLSEQEPWMLEEEAERMARLKHLGGD